MEIQIGDTFRSKLSGAYYIVLSVGDEEFLCNTLCIDDGTTSKIQYDFLVDSGWFCKVYL